MRILESKHANLALVELFPSLLLQVFWPDSQELNRNLVDMILRRESLDKGISTTNVGGWHSKKDLQDWDDESTNILVDRILAIGEVMNKRYFATKSAEQLENWRVQAWANINRFNAYNRFHTHIRNGNLWSGIYYVDDGYDNEDDRALSTRTIFADQHGVEMRGDQTIKKRYSVQSKAGLMLLFPSSLGHRVEPHRGSRPRISVAFNLKHENFTTINYEIEKSNAAKK